MRDIFGNKCNLGDWVVWPGRRGSTPYLMRGQIIRWAAAGAVAVIRCYPSGKETEKRHAYYDFCKASNEEN